MAFRRIAPILLCLGACATSTPPATPPPREASLQEAEAEFLAGRFDRAASLYERALPGVSATRRAEVLARIGKCLSGANEPEKAIAAFGDALAAGPSEELRVEIHYRRAVAFNKRWLPLEAMTDLLRVRGAPESVRGSAVRTEEFLYLLGVTMIRTGDWKGGLAVLRELVARFPDAAEASDAEDRLAMTDFRVQIARLREPKDLAGEAVRSAAGDFRVLVGHFARFADAVREMERQRRGGYPDAFVLP